MRKHLSLIVILLPLSILTISLFITPTCSAKSKSSCKWNNPIAWRKKIKVGMSEMQAIAILGWPQYIRRGSHSAFLYYQGKADWNKVEKKLIWPDFGYIKLRTEISPRSSLPKYIIESFTEPDWNRLPHDILEYPKIDRKFCIAPKGGPKWMNSEPWRKLRFGLRTRQVISLLGEPKLRQRGVRKTKGTNGLSANGPGGRSIVQKKDDQLSEIWKYGNSNIDELHFSYNERFADYTLSSWTEPYWPDVLKEIEKFKKEQELNIGKNQIIKYSILRQWKPNQEDNGLGLDILIKEEHTESSLVAFVKKLSADHNPVTITAWKSEIAWKDEEGKTPESKSDLLFVFIKNTTGKGAFNGFNEIRWMQEIGKLEHKYGSKTKF